MQNSLFKNNKDKLGYIIRDLLKKKNKELEAELDFTSTMASDYLNANSSKNIKNYHIFAVLKLYNLPQELFTLERLNTRKKVKLYLEEYQQKQKKLSNIYQVNHTKYPNLIGQWICYTYPDTIHARKRLSESLNKIISFIEEEKITIDEHFNVESAIHGRGMLQFYTKQTKILFEDKDTKDIIEYTFDNDIINNTKFHCVKYSTMKQFKQKVTNSGFFSKKTVTDYDVHFILGEEIDKVQFKSDLTFLERVSAYNDIKDY